MSDGYVKLWRRIRESQDIICDGPVLQVWIYLLAGAAYTPMKRHKYGKLVHLEPGQIIASIRELSSELGISKRQAERALALLIDSGRLTRGGGTVDCEKRGHSRGQRISVLSIVNWETYQGNGSKSGTLSVTEAGHSRGHSRDTQPFTPIRGKKGKKREEARNSLSLIPDEEAPDTIHEDAIKAWEHWAALSRQHGGRPRMTEAQVEAIEARMRRDGYSLEDLMEAAEGAWGSQKTRDGGYTAIKTIYRNSDNVEMNREKARAARAARNAPKSIDEMTHEEKQRLAQERAAARYRRSQ